MRAENLSSYGNLIADTSEGTLGTKQDDSVSEFGYS